jgi:hypothetical protein
MNTKGRDSYRDDQGHDVRPAKLALNPPYRDDDFACLRPQRIRFRTDRDPLTIIARRTAS